MAYEVHVDDNFHLFDESERYLHGEYATYEDALEVAKGIVDAFLRSSYQPGMTAERLLDTYQAFGEDPWIAPTPPGTDSFSAWAYAKRRCAEITDK